MYEEVHFRYCYLNNFDRFDLGDQDLWPSDAKINRVPLLPRMDVWTTFEDVRLKHIELLIGKVFGNSDLDIWPSDHIINRIPL